MNIEEFEKSLQQAVSFDRENTLFSDFKNQYEYVIEGNLNKLVEYASLDSFEQMPLKISDFYHKVQSSQSSQSESEQQIQTFLLEINQFVFALRKMIGKLNSLLQNKALIDFNDSSFQILEQKMFSTVTLLIQFSFLALKKLNGESFGESELFKSLVAFREIYLRFHPFQE